MRGRLADPSIVTWEASATGGPVPLLVFIPAVEEAFAAWGDQDLASFRPVAPGEEPSVRIGWHSDQAPRGCEPFGRDRSVAHSGPVGPGSFIHLDAGRPWHAGDPEGQVFEPAERAPYPPGFGPTPESIAVALRHEIGHLLGLDHCADPDALMHADTHSLAPTESDLAGLHSLYGGAFAAGPGDLCIRPAGVGTTDLGRCGADVAPPLRRVAPPGCSDWRLFDTDGDGADELLVWRTDAAGRGALMVYHFAHGPRLVRTQGPWPAVVPPDGAIEFHTAGDGGRWLIATATDGTRHVGRFDNQGQLWPGPATTPEWLPRDGPPDVGDLDGDGRLERILRAAP